MTTLVTFRTAVKAHKCDYCGTFIKSGQIYRRLFFPPDRFGKAETFKKCAGCQPLPDAMVAASALTAAAATATAAAMAAATTPPVQPRPVPQPAPTPVVPQKRKIVAGRVAA